MATIVNNPTPVEDQSSHTGLLLAVLVLFALAALLYFGGFRGATGTGGSANTGENTIERGVGGGGETNLNPGNGGANIQVPDQIDVNVNDQRDGQ